MPETDSAITELRSASAATLRANGTVVAVLSGASTVRVGLVASVWPAM